MTMRELIRWDRPVNIPLHQSGAGSSLATLQEEMNRLFEHFYTGALVHTTDWEQKLPSAPAVNISENETAFTVKVEFAGMDPKDVSVEVTDGYLILKGEKKEEKKDEGENYLRQEISYGSFYRTVALPETADCRKGEASFRNGIMTVIVPKKADTMKNPQKIPVKNAA